MSQRKGAVVTKHEEDMDLRRGPWTLEEDTLLMNYIACHGEGRWNLLARCSGLKRTGKSCRLRWLNYLKPDIKRGNLTPEEQLLILELHSKWGNRWSRIAQHLPGRTDNEIKNYWRTRVQKQARQLKVDANSAVFRDAVRCYWMPRLLEKTNSAQQSCCLRSVDPSNVNMVTSSSINQDVVPVHGYQQHYSMDPIVHHQCEGSENRSPSTSSGSTVPPPVPYFSELSSIGRPGQPSQSLFDPLLTDRFADVGFGLDGLDLGSDNSDSTLLDYLDSSCAMSSNNFGDSSIWSMDELCQVRKLSEWGGI